MSKLTILVGISGSGKSTFARKYTLKQPSQIRPIILNRDSLRESLTGLKASIYNKKPSYKIELCVNDIQKVILNNYGFIVVDATNLKLSYINGLISEYNLLKEYPLSSTVEKILFNIPPELAKQRVMKRDDLSYEEVKYIDKQYEDLQELKKHITFDKII